jgi:hypothetical protein
VHTWLQHELELKDDLTDSHPPLWDRLRLFGYQLENLDDFQALMDCTRPHGPLGETAARYFLGESAERFRSEFFREWSARQEKDWRVRFEAYEKLRRTAAEWPAAAADSTSGPAALWQIAAAIGNTQSWRDARPVAQRILELDPAHGDANLLEGQMQLEEGDCAGLESLERAMAADSASIIPACQLAARFLDARKETEAAARYRVRTEERRKDEQAIAGERARVQADDFFCTADCSGDTAAALLRAVERNSTHIRAAYLLRKRVAGDERRPLYVLGIERRLFPYQNAARANRLLLRRVSEVPGLPGDIVICVITRANRGLLAKWNAVPGALFWSAALLSATGHSPARNTWEPSQALPLLREQHVHRQLPVHHTTATAK